MLDIFYDISIRDVVYANGDFVTTTNASTQNGGIIQSSRCAIFANPMLGVGQEDNINAHPSEASFLMNRWKQQCINDGATLATWNNTVGTNGQLNISSQVSYV
jgi:hypothetical protein